VKTKNEKQKVKYNSSRLLILWVAKFGCKRRSTKVKVVINFVGIDRRVS
jgi:hypothetical protein